MKVSEYNLLEEAFHRSFGFMLNRIEDVMGTIPGRWEQRKGMDYADIKPGVTEDAEDRCFNEFMCALEEMGVELETVGRDLLELQVRKPLPPPGEEE